MVESKTLYAVRLREPNKARGFKMHSYTSAAGNQYTAGTRQSPSPLRYVSDPGELMELRGIEQFEIITSPSDHALRERLQVEMEQRARIGLPAVRANIVDQEAPQAAVIEERPRPRATALETVLAPVDIGDDDADETTDFAVVKKQPDQHAQSVAVPKRVTEDEKPVVVPRIGGRKPRHRKSS